MTARPEFLDDTISWKGRTLWKIYLGAEQDPEHPDERVCEADPEMGEVRFEGDFTLEELTALVAWMQTYTLTTSEPADADRDDYREER